MESIKNPVKISIETDYRDSYDHWFELNANVVFKRIALSSWGVSRNDMFKAFKALGIEHPRYDKIENFRDEQWIVVYVDQYAHCGDGKLLIRAEDCQKLTFDVIKKEVARGVSRLDYDAVLSLVEKYNINKNVYDADLMNLIATEYIDSRPGVTYRLMSCGGYSTWFRHESFEDWRSNSGDGDIFSVDKAEAIFNDDFECNVM